jgi:hypothetical protein
MMKKRLTGGPTACAWLDLEPLTAAAACENRQQPVADDDSNQQTPHITEPANPLKAIEVSRCMDRITLLRSSLLCSYGPAAALDEDDETFFFEISAGALLIHIRRSSKQSFTGCCYTEM